jgi:hypothetical protein
MRWAAAVLVLVCLPASAACDGPSMAQITAAIGTHRNGLAAVVGDAPISDYDLAQNVALRIALEGEKPDAKAIRAMAREELERLKMREAWIADARARNVTVAPAQVDDVIADGLALDHRSPAQLNAILSHAGVSMATLRGQIAIALAHGTVKGKLPFRIAQRACRGP